MERPLTQNIRPGVEPLDLRAYEQAGGYQSARKALKELTPQQVQDLVGKTTLRGRGGAGFPTGKKWSFVPMGPQSRHPKYLVVNGDEMEPGTFKDRALLEGDPHGMVEAVIVSAYAIEADIAYIFVRGEYHQAIRRVARAIEEARAAGYVGRDILGSGYSLDVRLHASAGRYMCGEETGLLNALEGRRAQPRTKPPHPPLAGLWGKPTLVNNVETLYNVPHIVNRGAEWFEKLSAGTDGGTKIYGVSGRVKRPGWWELPFGTTLQEILFDHAGGMQDGLHLRGLLPGGASTPMMTSDHLDVRMDFTGVEQAGARLGTGTVIVLDDRTCVVGMMLNLMQFYARESCGWCTPCREGLPWVRDILSAIEHGQGHYRDLAMLEMHCHRLAPGNTFCALAPGAMDPLMTSLKYFRADYERHVKEKRCPYRTA